MTVSFLDGETTRIVYEKFSVFDPSLNVDKASREQIPMRVAYGMTVHRAQGLILDSVVVHCTDFHQNGMLGVALSRVSSHKHLSVLGFCPQHFLPPHKVLWPFYCQPSKPFADNCCDEQERPVH